MLDRCRMVGESCFDEEKNIPLSGEAGPEIERKAPPMLRRSTSKEMGLHCLGKVFMTFGRRICFFFEKQSGPTLTRCRLRVN